MGGSGWRGGFESFRRTAQGFGGSTWYFDLVTTCVRFGVQVFRGEPQNPNPEAYTRASTPQVGDFGDLGYSGCGFEGFAGLRALI